MNEPHVEIFEPIVYTGPANLATAEGACEVALEIAEAARLHFNRTGDTPPLWAVIATYDLTKGKAYPRPTGLLMNMPGRTGTFYEQTEQKQAAAGMIRALVTRTAAIGVVTVNEVWFVTGDEKRQREKYPDLSLHPDRQEEIAMFCEHVRLKEPFVRQAQITRNALGKGMAAPFRDRYADCYGPGGRLVLKGRFTDLLQRTKLN